MKLHHKMIKVLKGCGGVRSRRLCQCIARNSSLTSLSLAWNGVGDGKEAGAGKPAVSVDEHALVYLVSKTETLRDLDITSCRLGVHLAKELAQAIRKNRSLRVLKIDGNPLGEGALDLEMELQARVVARTLERFTMANCSLDSHR